MPLNVGITTFKALVVAYSSSARGSLGTHLHSDNPRRPRSAKPERSTMSKTAYASGLDRTPANHVPLSPLGFLDRSADVYPDRVAVIHGDLRQTWAQTRDRCYRLASALVARGVQRGDTVAIIAPNTP